MTQQLPSVTATYVAFARALATRDPELSRCCRDPYAEALLPGAVRALLHARASRLVRPLSLGLCDHIALRTALIDRAIEHGTGEGMHQVVLLGAGFDARAHRLVALRDSVVYELDQPATQRRKRERAALLPRAARELRYVPCDLATTPLTSVLAPTGFDAHARTLWVWEGVTPYLTRDDVAQTLEAIAHLSAPDSMLIATYVTPDLIMAGEKLGALSVRALGALSEPVRFACSEDTFRQLLSDAGFAVLSDAAPVDAAPYFGVQVQRPSSLMPRERIAVAKNRKDSP